MASIYRHRDGKRWRAAVVLPDGGRRSKVFNYKTDADLWARNLEADADRGKWTDPRAGRVTLADFIEDDYLPSRRWRQSTREQSVSQINCWIVPRLGHKTLASIKPTDLGSFVAHLEDKGLAPATVAAVYRRLVAVLRAAERDRLIAVAPTLAAGEAPRKPKRRSDSVVPLTREQITKLIGAVPDRLKAFVVVMAGCGLRPGECAGLTLEAIDFDAIELRVELQMVTVAGGARLGPPKTDASIRTVPFGERVAEALTAHIDEYGTVPIEDRQLIFTNRDGRPLRRNVLGENWQRYAVDRLGIEAGGWHAIRHSYASALIEAGASVKVVQARLGHATAQETLDTYSHLWPESDDATRVASDALLS